jgi:hypothetical protein
MEKEKEEGEVAQAVRKLLDYIEKEGYAGYDPYDALNSPLLVRMRSKWMRVAATVFFRLSPVNLRKAFGVEKGVNPKAMGLLLSAYANLRRKGWAVPPVKEEAIFGWLKENRSPGWSGACWGYNFPWQDRVRLLDKGVPTIVNTAFIGHGLLDYYETGGNREALEMARSACEFILKDLPVHETDQGICFSYTPVKKNIVHNASVLGASLLGRVYAHTREDRLLEQAERSFAFTLHHQHENGLWAYNAYLESGAERFQTDWHQGFILDSLMWFIRAVNPADEKYRRALLAGAEFYRTQFTEEGACFWRLPRRWPADIHNQAQGIITFAKLEEFVPGSRAMAGRVARWTLDHLWDRKSGRFYYQKWPLFTNKITYLRWSQAWTLLALSFFL